MLPQAADKAVFLPGQVAVLEMEGRNPSYVAFASAPEEEEYEFLVRRSDAEESIANGLFNLAGRFFAIKTSGIAGRTQEQAENNDGAKNNHG